MSACSHSRSEPEKPAEDPKYDQLTSSVSRLQSRIEEMDAKLSSLTDKLEATRIHIDTVTGNYPLKTEHVGSLKVVEKQNKPEEPNEDSETAASQSEVVTSFKKALLLLKSGKYSDAEIGFHQFVQSFPKHILAGSAQFYAGEAYFLMGEYKLALNEYQKLIQAYSHSPRAASAAVRIAHCYSALGNATEATKQMHEAQTLYAGNPSLDWKHSQ